MVLCERYGVEKTQGCDAHYGVCEGGFNLLRLITIHCIYRMSGTAKV